VVADIAKLSVGREEYYTRELATDHEQYLSGHGESPGRWYGAGASTLGLQGEASVEGFRRMFDGRHPDTGELLGRAHGKGAVPAFDLVLRPTKSVSILYGLGDAEVGRAVLAAHHAGLADAVGYLDEQLGARRGHAGVEHVRGQGVLAVGFDHRTSREGDPLLHTHLVVANRVQGPDGRWTALDGRDVYRHRLAADAIYRAAYQRELSRTLGVEWTPADAYGNRELQGMPEALVRAFSKRTDQIELEVGRLEAAGRKRTPRLVKWAVQTTRKPKEHERPETLYQRWRAEAAERGVDADTLVRQVTGRVRDHDRGEALSAEAVERLFDQLAGPDGLTAQVSTFAHQDVLVALGAGLTGASRAELQDLADLFLADRAVSVVADRTLEERRWSTPELLAVEQRLVAAAVDRAGELAAVVSHDAVRAALAAHPTLGAEQQAMVRDVCQGGAGVALVVGRPGTGKTYTLGVARHAWQLDGYRLLAAAPTGIATVSLEAEGFEDVATVDRLLGELDRSRDAGTDRSSRRSGAGDAGPAADRLLDQRTVLVVDEAGMVGSRKLTRLLAHAHEAGAKVVLVGDDRQLAAIDAGGGFRALRLRLGASELVENRRQLHAWEREALELVRSGLVEEAVVAYQAHDRLVAADSKQALMVALLQDWWQAYADAEAQPDQDVLVLARRRDEVDRLNSYCQQVLATHGRLGPERLQVEDRELRVGDRVVCGNNAIAQLGVANGSRGTITALDPDQRTLTIRLDGKQPKEVTLPQWYLDGRQPAERNRRVDLAYATTGHRAQGLTRWRALVRITGGEDVNWLNVQLSRARQETRLYAVVGPEPQADAELDLPERELPDGYAQLAQALARAGAQTLAIDTPATLDLRQLSTRELREERDQLRRLLDQAPKYRSRELARAQARAAAAEQQLAALADRAGQPRQPTRMLRLLRRGPQLGPEQGVVTVAAQQADRAADAERALRQHQQQRQGWLEANAHLGPAYRRVMRELAWQGRAAGLAQEAIEQDRPAYVREALGPVPASTRGRRAWRQAAAAIEDYRQTYDVTEPDRALGPAPRDPGQRVAWQRAHRLVERVSGKQRAERDRHPTDRQPTDRQPISPAGTAGDQARTRQADAHQRSPLPAARRGPERAAG
jgi:conjugative relaxase-like TrwC/TraI family protein